MAAVYTLILLMALMLSGVTSCRGHRRWGRGSSRNDKPELTNMRYRICTNQATCNQRDGIMENYECSNKTLSCADQTTNGITKVVLTNNTEVCFPKKCNPQCKYSDVPQTNVTSCVYSQRSWRWSWHGWNRGRRCMENTTISCCNVGAEPAEECLMGVCLQRCDIAGSACLFRYGCTYEIQTPAMTTSRRYCQYQSLGDEVCTKALQPETPFFPNPRLTLP